MNVSGGVKTREGKEVSKYNAVRHGVLTRILLPTEIKEARRLYYEFLEDYNPKTQAEYILIQDMSTACIRKMRAINSEREYFTQILNPPIHEEKVITLPLLENPIVGDRINGEKQILLVKKGYVAKVSDGDIDKIEKTFVRYINACERQFYRALHELQRIQSIQKGLKPTSIAVDFMGEGRQGD